MRPSTGSTVRNRMPVRLALALAATACVLLTGLGSPLHAIAQDGSTGTRPQELRGVWITNVDSDVLNTKQKIEEAMDYLADRGFNVVFPVVWNKGYTLHPSAVAAEAFGIDQDPYFKNQGRDPLAEIIVEAHRRGMEVIPWFEYGFASVYGDQTGGHIIKANPHWAARNSKGTIAQANSFYWMNGFHHEVQQFMLDLIQEVIDNYDVDGIQGDDRLPAMPAQAGYSEYTRQLYASEHNGADVPAQHNDGAFLQWKADKLTNFAGRLYRQVKETDPNLIVSMSPSIYRWSLDNYHQDWPNWIDSGYVDIVHPQVYRYSLGDYQGLVREMFGQLPTSPFGYLYAESKSMVFPGVVIKAGSAFNGPDYVLQAIEFNRQYGMNGEVFFFYEGLDEKNQFLGDSLRKHPYRENALLPYRDGKARRPGAFVLHENDPGVTLEGAWSDTSTAGVKGGSRLTAGRSGARATYSFDVPVDAWYRIHTWIPNGARTTAGAHYRIMGAADTMATVLNHQMAANRRWTEIGSIYLTAGRRDVVVVDADSAIDTRNLYLDAMMIMVDRKRSPDAAFETATSSLEPARTELPQVVSLHQNHPNPFNPSTTLRFELDQPRRVTLEVFDLMGRRISVVARDQWFQAGSHSLPFDATGLSSGAYLYRLSSGDIRLSRSMHLIK